MSKSGKTAVIFGGVVILVLVVLPTVIGLVSGWQYGGWGMMGHGMMGGLGGMWLMPVLWIAVLGLIIWAVAAAVQGSGRSGSSESDSGRADSALEVLKRRYARGDIDREEYEARKRDLV